METDGDTDGLMRHIRACRSARLPGERLRLRLEGTAIGWVLPPVAEMLAGVGARRGEDAGGTAEINLPDPAALERAARQVVATGATRWRGEAFDVRSDEDGRVVTTLDRGVLPIFGVRASGAHLNGLVRRADGPYVWVARRAADKALDPGKLDHVAAGGVPAGLSPRETLVKEAGEEAGMPPDPAASAAEVAVIAYDMERPEGLRRDRIHCFDLELPEDFTPTAVDGEVAGFELWPLPRAIEAVRRTDAFKFNVNLVLIDLALRERLLQGAEARILRAALSGAAGPHP